MEEMVSKIKSYGDSFHNIFVCGDWNYEKIKKYFGDSPTILTKVVERRSCSVDVIKLLLKQGADINCQNDSGYSPLMMALEITNDEGVIRELLEGGADVNKADDLGRTPLLSYLKREDCSVGIVEVLLDFKADVNCMDVFGESPLLAATAIRQAKDDAVIRVLVERIAEINDLRYLHYTPLLVLLRRKENCSVDVVKLLLAKGADINCVDECGCSPLVTALIPKGDEAVIQALLENGANVNIVSHFYATPLLVYLHFCYSADCSVSIVKLLLHHKANVNSKNSFGKSPLTIALVTKRDETIIRMLLEGGADANTLDGSGRSPLCIAFKHSSIDIVKLLLDAGSSPYTCKYHISPLHCATGISCSSLREDILKLLVEINLDVDSVDDDGRSVLCYALQKGATVHDIQLLLDVGASLNTCLKHSSPLSCATDGHVGSPLRKDVVQLLLDNGASVGDDGLSVLQNALCFCRYETGAIQLLLDLPGMDAHVVAKSKCDESFLHMAVWNNDCRLDALKLLIDREAQVHSDIVGKTPLQCAVIFNKKKSEGRIINFFLQNGSRVNAKTKYGETPLMLAVKMGRPAYILKELLIAGAHIGKKKFCRGGGTVKCELLVFLARQWELSDSSTHLEPINSYKMLMKFFLLQNPECDVENYLQCNPKTTSRCVDKLMKFVNECLSELRIMDSLQVGYGHTFRMFVSRKCVSVDKTYDLDQILICLINYKFPVFFDVISARIGRSIMEAEVNKLQVYYTRKIHPNLLFSERINLNSDVVFKISKYLPDDDLLKFILAFYKPINQNDSGEASKDHTLLGKRSSEPSSKPHKCPKTHR